MKDALAHLLALIVLALLFVGGAYALVQALLVAASGRGFEQLIGLFP